MEEVQVSPPQPMEIRIKVVCTSLCRSDLSAWETQNIFPRIFGHEASGIVESVGQGVTEFKEGNHVLTVFIGECMTCRQCKSGKSNTCQALGLERKGKSTLDVLSKSVRMYVPLEKICLLSCGVAAGFVDACILADSSMLNGQNVLFQ
ncbi:hypothetical protein L6164_030003 [Bauhinia variegata]|uniref:Uncharacterized protein n=1 Tax=Bauhinia variegata TaxID=167791 RepID=A0ACB9LBC7_BAUVA|nr:hypothetical protein L6164_030003 [Bauhinia variegata]